MVIIIPVYDCQSTINVYSCSYFRFYHIVFSYVLFSTIYIYHVQYLVDFNKSSPPKTTLKGCPEKLKQTAYFSLIRSFMEYGATIGDPYQKIQQ